MNESELSDESILTGTIVVVLVVTGAVPMAALLSPVQKWMIENQILVMGEDVVIAIPGTAVGLDLIRLIALAFFAVVILLITVLCLRRLRRKKVEER